MAYTGDRFIHDADSHVMETPDWLIAHADPAHRHRMPLMFVGSVGDDKPDQVSTVDAILDTIDAPPGSAASPLDGLTRRHADERYRADNASQVMLRKNWAGMGSYIAADRPEALDHMGFASQLVFNTFASAHLVQAEHADDVELTYAMATAHNRAMTEFCSVDPRLLAVAYVPLMDFTLARRAAEQAIAMGAAALMIPSACPRTHSPSHVALDPVWAAAQEAGLPIVLHVGGGGKLLAPEYFVNGLPPVPDFHGGAENFRSVDYMAIPNPPMQTMSTLIFDGVLDRFPHLKWGVIEQGASWVPGWMRNLDSAFNAFRKNEERLQALSAKPSEIVRRQVRVTPYPHEDTGWIIANSAPEICLFSSDFPHVEGGRNPLGRFDAALDGRSPEEIRRFYVDNFVDLMGDVLVRRGIPLHAAA